MSVVGAAQALPLLTPSAAGKVTVSNTLVNTLYEVETQYNVDYVYTLERPLSDYPRTVGSNDFASIELTGIGNSVFDLFLWQSGAWEKVKQLSNATATSASYDFMKLDNTGAMVGVDLFKITVAILDQPPGPFVTGLTFAKTEDSTVFFQNALSRNVPEPATLMLMGAGLLGMRLRKKRS